MRLDEQPVFRSYAALQRQTSAVSPTFGQQMNVTCHRAAAVAVASGFYRQDKVRGLSRMATTLWDSPCNGLAHREVAVNDEDNGATPSMAIRVMAPDVDVLPSGADYLGRPWRR
jgi:hypothetical protein